MTLKEFIRQFVLSDQQLEIDITYSNNKKIGKTMKFLTPSMLYAQDYRENLGLYDSSVRFVTTGIYDENALFIAVQIDNK